MNMFGLEGSGFIIAISVCLLLVGAVVYYFNARVATLEKGLTAQSGILQTFIANVKHQLMSVPPPPSGGGGAVKTQESQEVPDNGATLSAMEAAQEWSGKPRSLVPVSDDDNSDEEDDDDDDSSLEDSDEDSQDDDEDDDDDDDDNDDDDDDDEDDKVINLGENITDGSLDGLLNVAPITVMKVDSTNAPAVAMVMQALEIDGKEVVDLTSQKDGPQITEIEEVKTDDAVNEISLGELDTMESLDNTVEESIKSSSLGSSSNSLDDGDDATADTNTSIPAGTDFSKMKVATLKGLAKKAKIPGYSSFNKAALVSALKNHASQ